MRFGYNSFNDASQFAHSMETRAAPFLADLELRSEITISVEELRDASMPMDPPQRVSLKGRAVKNCVVRIEENTPSLDHSCSRPGGCLLLSEALSTGCRGAT